MTVGNLAVTKDARDMQKPLGSRPGHARDPLLRVEQLSLFVGFRLLNAQLESPLRARRSAHGTGAQRELQGVNQCMQLCLQASSTILACCEVCVIEREHGPERQE